MNARRVEVTFSVAEWDLLNERRGREPRASFVKHHYLRALESALGGVEESEHSSLDHSVSAPVRAPVVEPDAFAAGEVMDPPEKVADAKDLAALRASMNRQVISDGQHHKLMLARQEILNKRGKK